MTTFRAALLAAALTLAGAARAQTLDYNPERLRLDPTARGSLILGDGEVLPDEAGRISATIHYEKQPLIATDDGDLRGRGLLAERSRAADVVTERTTLHLIGAIGFLDGLELGLEVPIIVEQASDFANIEGGGNIGAPWLQLRSGSTKPEGSITAAVSFAASPGWGNGTDLAGNKGWSLVPGLEFAVRLGKSMVIANISGLLRTEEVVLTNGETLSHEITAAVGWATTGRPLRVEADVRASFDAGLGQSVETLVGVRYQLGPADLYALGGPGFLELPGTPTFRLLAGVGLDFGGAAK